MCPTESLSLHKEKVTWSPSTWSPSIATGKRCFLWQVLWHPISMMGKRNPTRSLAVNLGKYFSELSSSLAIHFILACWSWGWTWQNAGLFIWFFLIRSWRKSQELTCTETGYITRICQHWSFEVRSALVPLLSKFEFLGYPMQGIAAIDLDSLLAFSGFLQRQSRMHKRKGDY